jgi:hypothetical protein
MASQGSAFTPKPPKPARPAQAFSRPSVPRPPRPTIFPAGPKQLHVTSKPEFIGGPGEPPLWFLNLGYNSRDEWPPYWWLTKKKGPEGQGWVYQKNELNGRKMPGGAVVDFAVLDQSPPIAIRVQTERFHLAVNFRKQAGDREQRVALSNAGFTVADIYSYTYIHDPSGRAVSKLMSDILGGRHQPDPITTGTTSVRPS